MEQHVAYNPYLDDQSNQDNMEIYNQIIQASTPYSQQQQPSQQQQESYGGGGYDEDQAYDSGIQQNEPQVDQQNQQEDQAQAAYIELTKPYSIDEAAMATDPIFQQLMGRQLQGLAKPELREHTKQISTAIEKRSLELGGLADQLQQDSRYMSLIGAQKKTLMVMRQLQNEPTVTALTSINSAIAANPNLQFSLETAIAGNAFSKTSNSNILNQSMHSSRSSISNNSSSSKGFKAVSALGKRKQKEEQQQEVIEPVISKVLAIPTGLQQASISAAQSTARKILQDADEVAYKQLLTKDIKKRDKKSNLIEPTEDDEVELLIIRNQQKRNKRKLDEDDVSEAFAAPLNAIDRSIPSVDTIPVIHRKKVAIPSIVTGNVIVPQQMSQYEEQKQSNNSIQQREVDRSQLLDQEEVHIADQMMNLEVPEQDAVFTQHKLDKGGLHQQWDLVPIGILDDVEEYLLTKGLQRIRTHIEPKEQALLEKIKKSKSSKIADNLLQDEYREYALTSEHPQKAQEIINQVLQLYRSKHDADTTHIPSTEVNSMLDDITSKIASEGKFLPASILLGSDKSVRGKADVAGELLNQKLSLYGTQGSGLKQNIDAVMNVLQNQTKPAVGQQQSVSDISKLVADKLVSAQHIKENGIEKYLTSKQLGIVGEKKEEEEEKGGGGGGGGGGKKVIGSSLKQLAKQNLQFTEADRQGMRGIKGNYVPFKDKSEQKRMANQLAPMLDELLSPDRLTREDVKEIRQEMNNYYGAIDQTRISIAQRTAMNKILDEYTDSLNDKDNEYRDEGIRLGIRNAKSLLQTAQERFGSQPLDDFNKFVLQEGIEEVRPIYEQLKGVIAVDNFVRNLTEKGQKFANTSNEDGFLALEELGTIAYASDLLRIEQREIASSLNEYEENVDPEEKEVDKTYLSLLSLKAIADDEQLMYSMHMDKAITKAAPYLGFGPKYVNPDLARTELKRVNTQKGYVPREEAFIETKQTVKDEFLQMFKKLYKEELANTVYKPLIYQALGAFDEKQKKQVRTNLDVASELSKIKNDIREVATGVNASIGRGQQLFTEMIRKREDRTAIQNDLELMRGEISGGSNSGSGQLLENVIQIDSIVEQVIAFANDSDEDEDIYESEVQFSKMTKATTTGRIAQSSQLIQNMDKFMTGQSKEVFPESIQINPSAALMRNNESAVKSEVMMLLKNQEVLVSQQQQQTPSSSAVDKMLDAAADSVQNKTTEEALLMFVDQQDENGDNSNANQNSVDVLKDILQTQNDMEAKIKGKLNATKQLNKTSVVQKKANQQIEKEAGIIARQITKKSKDIKRLETKQADEDRKMQAEENRKQQLNQQRIAKLVQEQEIEHKQMLAQVEYDNQKQTELLELQQQQQIAQALQESTDNQQRQIEYQNQLLRIAEQQKVIEEQKEQRPLTAVRPNISYDDYINPFKKLSAIRYEEDQKFTAQLNKQREEAELRKDQQERDLQSKTKLSQIHLDTQKSRISHAELLETQKQENEEARFNQRVANDKESQRLLLEHEAKVQKDKQERELKDAVTKAEIEALRQDEVTKKLQVEKAKHEYKLQEMISKTEAKAKATEQLKKSNPFLVAQAQKEEEKVKKEMEEVKKQIEKINHQAQQYEIDVQEKNLANDRVIIGMREEIAKNFLKEEHGKAQNQLDFKQQKISDASQHLAQGLELINKEYLIKQQEIARSQTALNTAHDLKALQDKHELELKKLQDFDKLHTHERKQLQLKNSNNLKKIQTEFALRKKEQLVEVGMNYRDEQLAGINNTHKLNMQNAHNDLLKSQHQDNAKQATDISTANNTSAQVIATAANTVKKDIAVAQASALVSNRKADIDEGRDLAAQKYSHEFDMLLEKNAAEIRHGKDQFANEATRLGQIFDADIGKMAMAANFAQQDKTRDTLLEFGKGFQLQKQKAELQKEVELHKVNLLQKELFIKRINDRALMQTDATNLYWSMKVRQELENNHVTNVNSAQDYLRAMYRNNEGDAEGAEEIFKANGNASFVQETIARAQNKLIFDIADPTKHNNRDLYNITQYTSDPTKYLSSVQSRAQFTGKLDKIEQAANDGKIIDKDVIQNDKIMIEAYGDVMSQLYKADPGLQEGAVQVNQPSFENKKRIQLTLERETASQIGSVVQCIDKGTKVDATTLLRIGALQRALHYVSTSGYLQLGAGGEGLAQQLEANKKAVSSLQLTANSHNEAYDAYLSDIILQSRQAVAIQESSYEEKEKADKRNFKLEKMKIEQSNQIALIIQKLGLSGGGGDGGNKMNGYKQYSNGGGGGGYFNGHLNKMRYINQRTNQMYHGDGEDELQSEEARQKYQGQTGHGKSATGNYGSAASAGKGLQKVAGFDKKLTAEDLELLKNLTVDKRTGLALKIDAEGNVVQLTEQEKERAAFIIIELCLFIYAKHVKTVSEVQLTNYRTAIKATNTLDGDEQLLQLLKVANVVANKSLGGQIDKGTISKYVEGLAGKPYEEQHEDQDGDMIMQDEEEEEEEEEERPQQQQQYRKKVYHHRPRQPRKPRRH